MRTIRFDQINEYVRQNVVDLVVATALEAERQLKEASPIDTGTFKRNWQNDVGIKEYSASISNNLPYAERLANGWSQQAPSGWVQTIAKNMQLYAEKQARNIEVSD
mgnify:CR=1 FL=1|tara:strand:+ start:899 stop:1216 length:318 start_codon:yes stop_codon:yes gene_type:complete